MDILTLNRYSSWYSDSGHLEIIQYQVYKEFEAFTKMFKKPMLFTEYGAGSLSGLHSVRKNNGDCTYSCFVKIKNITNENYIGRFLTQYVL